MTSWIHAKHVNPDDSFQKKDQNQIQLCFCASHILKKMSTASILWYTYFTPETNRFSEKSIDTAVYIIIIHAQLVLFANVNIVEKRFRETQSYFISFNKTYRFACAANFLNAYGFIRSRFDCIWNIYLFIRSESVR